MDAHTDARYHVHRQDQPDDAGKPGASKGARRVWREPVGKRSSNVTFAGWLPYGECVYEDAGVQRKFYGFTAVLGYSRMRFVTFVKRCDTPTLIRCLMEAFEYFGGLTRTALTDRMKSVLLEMEDNKPRWNPRFADFMVSIGVGARVCKAYTPQTKGKVERTVSHVKKTLWAGINFTDLDDLNRQAYTWCERINARVHRTTHARPVKRQLSRTRIASWKNLTRKRNMPHG